MIWYTNASPAQRGIRCCPASTVGYQRLAGAETYPTCNEAVQSYLSVLYWAACSASYAVIPRLELLPYLLSATFLLLIPCLELTVSVVRCLTINSPSGINVVVFRRVGVDKGNCGPSN